MQHKKPKQQLQITST